MLEFDNIRLDLESFEEPLAKLKDALHIDRVTDQISELRSLRRLSADLRKKSRIIRIL